MAASMFGNLSFKPMPVASSSSSPAAVVTAKPAVGGKVINLFKQSGNKTSSMRASELDQAFVSTLSAENIYVSIMVCGMWSWNPDDNTKLKALDDENTKKNEPAVKAYLDKKATLLAKFTPIAKLAVEKGVLVNWALFMQTQTVSSLAPELIKLITFTVPENKMLVHKKGVYMMMKFEDAFAFIKARIWCAMQALSSDVVPSEVELGNAEKTYAGTNFIEFFKQKFSQVAELEQKKEALTTQLRAELMIAGAVINPLLLMSCTDVRQGLVSNAQGKVQGFMLMFPEIMGCEGEKLSLSSLDRTDANFKICKDNYYKMKYVFAQKRGFGKKRTGPKARDPAAPAPTVAFTWE